MAAVMKEVEPSTSLRRVSEDKHLRSFLSAHFNSSEYVADIIRQGKSEEIFADISKSMEDVKEEIQRYITQNKGHLMGGMQGVAALAERYSMLSITSQKLHRSVEKLKREALASHDLISLRTRELERIHQVGTLLRQLRQFAHSYGQLEHLLAALKGNGNMSQESTTVSSVPITEGGKPLTLDTSMDIRQMSTVAKLVSELEGLIALHHLNNVDYLRERKDGVLQFGLDLRQMAEERLLQALKESDQASAASCLQIFFNLGTLPRTLLFAVDAVIVETVRASRTLIDVDELGATFPEQLGGSSGGRGGKGGSRTAAALAVVASMGAKKASQTKSGATGRGGRGQAGDKAQSEVLLRAALKETATVWAEKVGELARQVQILQRVLIKKEDPNTHRKFTQHVSRMVSSGLCDELTRSHRELRQLAAGDLLSLYFSRLETPLSEMVHEMAKRAPSAAVRLYPFLRSMAIVTTESKYQSLSVTSSSLSSAHFLSLNNEQDKAIGQQHGQNALLFGALDAAAGDEPCFDVSSVLGNRRRNDGSDFDKRYRSRVDNSRPHVGTADEVGGGPAPGVGNGSDNEVALIKALAPMKERYLSSCLSKMMTPINQMFPELDGYTAAVPSKRDVQELLKAVGVELIAAVSDGGLSLLEIVCAECVKAMQLIVSKVRDMAINASIDASLLELIVVDSHGNKNTVRPVGMEDQEGGKHSVGWLSKKIGSHANSFLRNSSQEHNLRLIALLAQLRDHLATLPSFVAASISSNSSNSSSSSSSSSSDNQSLSGFAGSRTRDIEGIIMTAVVDPVSCAIDGLVASALVSPTVLMVASYTKSVLFTLPTEGSRGLQTHSGAGVGDSITASSGDPDDALLQGCSPSVSRAIQELPALLSTYFGSLPQAVSIGGTGLTPQKREEQRNFPVTSWALEELCLHIMNAYISAAALVRPINEEWRLRTAKELSALEHAMSTYSGLNINRDLNQGNVDSCPVYLEFRAFRRFIFREEEFAVSASMLSPQGKSVLSSEQPSPSPSKSTSKIGIAAPSLEDMLALPYFKHLRPSTALAYICSCSPSQLPSPYEGDDEAIKAVLIYLTQLTSLDDAQGGLQQRTDSGSFVANAASVRSLYKSGHLVKDRRGNVTVAATWKAVPQEMASWICFQSSIDKYLQRISVAEPSKRVGMRSWADSLMSIGNYYFGGR